MHYSPLLLKEPYSCQIFSLVFMQQFEYYILPSFSHGIVVCVLKGGLGLRDDTCVPRGIALKAQPQAVGHLGLISVELKPAHYMYSFHFLHGKNEKQEILLMLSRSI